MPSDPAWSLEAGAEVNGEGNQLTLNVKMTTAGALFTTSHKIDVVKVNAFTTSPSARGYVGAINGWRFNAPDGTLLSSVSNADGIRTIGICDVVGPTSLGGDNYEVTFKYRITLNDGARIAINNAPTDVNITDLTVGADPDGGDTWLLVSWLPVVPLHPHPDPMGAPEFGGPIDLDATAVGMVPPGQQAVGDALSLFVDAYAEGVAHGATVPDLATWTDLAQVDELSGEPSTDRPELFAGTGNRAHVDFTTITGGPQRFRTATSPPPIITSPATIAAVFEPDTAASSAHVIGRFTSSNPSWRLHYDGSVPNVRTVVYEAVGPGGTETVSLDVELSDHPVFVVLRRVEDDDKTWAAWINGRPADSGAFSAGVNTGSGDISVGARVSGTSWGDAYIGEINQAAIYNADLTDLELSLLMHQMADRAMTSRGSYYVPMDLGTPIPLAWQNQPYITAAAAKHLDRRPIAVINLGGANWSDNIFGQAQDWRGDSGQPDVEALKDKVREALNGCDQFEIMFNRPGGAYSQDVVLSYVFGSKDGQDIITTDQWAGMVDLWDYFHLAADNDDQNKNANHWPKRRGWFYTGSGLPVDNNGHLDNTGFMARREVGPVTPRVYLDTILSLWTAQDARFQCFMLDAAVNFFGKFVEMVHDSTTNSDFLLVGEAIPQSDPIDFPDEAASRLSAPWFGLSGTPSGPWWNKDTRIGNHNRTSIGQGNNYAWTTDWETKPIYFGVQYSTTLQGATLDLSHTSSSPGMGDNLKIGNIYNWARREAIPVSWSAQTHQKVGAAWNYATGRVMPSRLVRCPRLLRRARC